MRELRLLESMVVIVVLMILSCGNGFYLNMKNGLRMRLRRIVLMFILIGVFVLLIVFRRKLKVKSVKEKGMFVKIIFVQWRVQGNIVLLIFIRWRRQGVSIILDILIVVVKRSMSEYKVLVQWLVLLQFFVLIYWFMKVKLVVVNFIFMFMKNYMRGYVVLGVESLSFLSFLSQKVLVRLQSIWMSWLMIRG